MSTEGSAPSPDLPVDAAGRAERLSTQALAIAFVGREQEMEYAVQHLAPGERLAHGRALVVHGDSGTGKTFFARELLRQLCDAEPEGLCLYIDIANDEYQSSRTIPALLKMSLVAGRVTGASTINVPEDLSLLRFRRQARQRGVGRSFMRAIAHGFGSAIGVGSAVGAALKHSGSPDTAQFEDELAGYLSWVTKRQPVFLVVDNIQFLNLDVRLTVESVLQRVDKNIRLIALDRTIGDTSQLSPPVRCFPDATLSLRLGHLTRAETLRLVTGAIGEDEVMAARLADDIYTKTRGLAKDVEYCLRQYVLELGRGARAGAIEGLLSTVDSLPLIHRQFLVIATLLDGGVKKTIARGTVSRLVAVYDRAELDDVVDELVARDYLRFNTDTGDRLRPGHERIVTAIRDLADDELHEEVRRSLVQELASALEASDLDENETYLLHCLVGVQTAKELTRNLHHIARLIQSQHRQDQFSYLVALADELQEILPLLPEHVLTDLLDAMQKSSAFEQGLQLVRLLDSKDVSGAAGRKIYRLKYLTQAYRYDEALTLAEELRDDEWGSVYRINALMALDRLDDARAIAQDHLSSTLSECQAVLRRNTITLFEPETAMLHLDEAYRYFERQQSEFRLATVDTNRGLVCLHTGRLGDALRFLDRAFARMQYVGSREAFQAQVNLAIRSALLGEHDAALATLDAAALHVPHALLFDRVKLRMNRTVIARIGGTLDATDCERVLEECITRIRGVQMPYLHRALRANIAAARGENKGSAAGADDDRVRLTIAAPPQVPNDGSPWTLMMSVHWRY